MSISKFWKHGLLVLTLAFCIALTLAHAYSHTPEHSVPVEKTLLKGSEVPAPVRSILERACQDCHSDNTSWPWYSAIPPISWQVRADVTRGRAAMNLSRWSEYTEYQRRGFMLAIQSVMQAGIMPPPKYLWMHADARLSNADLKLVQEWALAKNGVRSKKVQSSSLR